jgi:hypothetical protein
VPQRFQPGLVQVTKLPEQVCVRQYGRMDARLHGYCLHAVATTNLPDYP